MQMAVHEICPPNNMEHLTCRFGIYKLNIYIVDVHWVLSSVTKAILQSTRKWHELKKLKIEKCAILFPSVSPVSNIDKKEKNHEKVGCWRQFGLGV